MDDSIKKFVVSKVFLGNFFKYLQIKDNRRNTGFNVAMSGVLTPVVFENLYLNRDYFKKNHVSWYVSTDKFEGYEQQLSCICFYLDEDDD